jgi:pimeloyl-ACP methyl ester carboxylesterase
MSRRESGLRIEPFTVDVSDEVLQDLDARIRNTRWPESAPGSPWEQGTDREYLQALLDYWTNGFDWRAQERMLNSFEHFRADVGGVSIHFVHARARYGDGIPLILTHGWPSTFVEMLPLVPLLTDPDAHGIDGPAFDLVIPSLPGYGFSERPRHPVTYRYTAGLWHALMRGLGYERYGAGGTDFGAGVSSFMALVDPEPLIGLHMTNLELSPYVGPSARPLCDAEAEYLRRSAQWDKTEGAYRAIQSTKPQTLAYGLNDSPAGLAAWVLEKWRSWSQSGGNLDAHFSRDLLLTVVTLYWVTATIAPSMRDYLDNQRWQDEPLLTADDFVSVPTAIASFPNMLVPDGEAPREWAERLYNIQRWTSMPRGGHFAAAEEPLLVARDIAAFFATAGTPAEVQGDEPSADDISTNI